MAVKMQYGTRADAQRESESGGGGSTETRTLLWTNPNPNSAITNTTVTLSETALNFDWLEVRYKFSLSQPTEYLARFKIKDADGNIMYPIGHYVCRMAMCQETSSGTIYERRLCFSDSSGTDITISACNRVNTAGTSTNNLIPLEFYGVKKNGDQGSTEKEIVGWSFGRVSPTTIARKWGKEIGGTWQFTPSTSVTISLKYLTIANDSNYKVTITANKACHVVGYVVKDTTVQDFGGNFQAGDTVYTYTPPNPGCNAGSLTVID